MFTPRLRLVAASAVTFVASLAGPSAQAALYNGTVLTDAPLTYHRFEEGAGTTATSQGSLGISGSYVNVGLAQNSATAGLGKAGQFAGNAAVRVTDNTSFDVGSGAFSVELWFNTNTTNRGDLFTYKGGGGDYGIHSASQGGNTVSAFFNGFPSAASPAPANTWHHLVNTRAADGTFKVYVDGVLTTTGSNNNTWNIANDILIGANHSGDPANLAIQFNGLIDEVAIYNKELSAARVSAHYAAAFTATAAPVSIVVPNGDFESPNLANGPGTAGELFTTEVITGWTTFGPSNQGVQDPSPSRYVQNVTTGAINDPGQQANGDQFAFANAGGGNEGILSGVLAVTAPGTLYEMTVALGNGLDSGLSGNYLLEFLVDGVLAGTSRAIGSAQIADGDFVDFSNSFVAAGAGNLQLRLSFTGSGQAHFDNVRLTAAAAIVPEPAMALMGLMGLAGLATRRRRIA